MAATLDGARSRNGSGSPSSPSCEVCRGSGYIKLAIPGGNGSSVARCECQKQKVIQSKLEAIPNRFRDASFANYVPTDSAQEIALNKISSEFTGSYFIHGEYSRGKTHLATAQYRHIVMIERNCMFMTMAELMSELRKAEMDPDYFSTLRHRVRHSESFHLFIDDVDKFKVTDFKFEVLFDLFDTIYRRNLGLTMTSNFSLRELRDQLDGSILRRIDDICTVIEL
jgi:DNA replication protein DnaC